MSFWLVLDQEIAEEICALREGKTPPSMDISLLTKALQYYRHPPLLPNKNLLRRYYGDNTTSTILSQYSSLYSQNTTLEKLADHTQDKIILNTNKDDFPYVNIMKESKIQHHLCSTFFKNENRQNAINHFKALFKNAKQIFFYDPHLDKCNIQKAFFQFVEKCFPKHELKIYIIDQGIVQTLGTKLKTKCKSWSLNQDKLHKNHFSKLHDRYIVIDKRTQIVLTSGIDNLLDNTKDFTYIVRPHKIN